MTQHITCHYCGGEIIGNKSAHVGIPKHNPLSLNNTQTLITVMLVCENGHISPLEISIPNERDEHGMSISKHLSCLYKTK